MKRKFQFYITILIGCFVLAACSHDDQSGPEPGPEPVADYTVMMYGCGGGNLDDDLLYNLEQVAGYGYSENVQFAAKIKFSIPYQGRDETIYGGTRLFTLTTEGMQNERVGSQGFRLDDPQNLADFITDTKKRLPAKQYILILWNHGCEFAIGDQLVADSYPEKVVDSRAIVFDDNTGDESISIFEQEEAFKRANVKLDMIYWDVCMMHTIENICQIKDYTRYVMGAAHLTPGLGGNYALLMNVLEKNSDLLDAMEEYVPATVNHWVNIEGIGGPGDGMDLAISDMNYVDEVAQNMKKCISSLIKYRDGMKPGSPEERQYYELNGTNQIDTGNSDDEGYGDGDGDGDGEGEGEGVSGGKYPYYTTPNGSLYYFYVKGNSVDMLSAFIRIGNGMLDGQMSADATRLKLSVDKMIPISYCAGTPNFITSISVGINWMDKESFETTYSKYPIPTLEGLYSKLRFEQIAGWSRFLKTNEMQLVQ